VLVSAQPLDVLVIGAGRIGCALARRAAGAGLTVGLTSRRPSTVRAATERVPPEVVRLELLAEAVARAHAAAPWLVAVDRAEQAATLLAPLGARLAGREVVLACFEDPVRLEQAARALEAHGARVVWLGVLGTAAALAEGHAPLLTDLPADAQLSATLARLGPLAHVRTRALGAGVALAFPVAYSSVLVLHGLVLRAAERVGLGLEDALEALALDRGCARPLEPLAEVEGPEDTRASTDAAAAVDALIAAVTSAVAELGLSPAPLSAVAGLWSAWRARLAASEVEALLDASPGARRLGALTAVVGLGLRLVLAELRAGLGPEGASVLDRAWATVDVLVAPVEVARVLARPRFVLGLRGAPQVEVAQVAAELARVQGASDGASPLGRWVLLLAELMGRAAARAVGEPTDVSLVHLELGEPAASAHKQQVLAELRAHHSPGRVTFFERAGLSFVQGAREGPFLADVDDTRVLLNLHTNGGVFNFGHRAPELVQALRDGLGQVDIGNHHLPSARRARLAARLTRTFPARLSRVCFTPSATEATDFVVRLARAATGRRRVVAVDGGFHGTTGVGAHLGDERFVAWAEPRSAEVTRVRRWDLDAMAQALAAGDVAVVLAETVQASSGMHLPPPGYYPTLAELCRDAGVPLVLDEVQTGWGRTGKLWAFEHFGVVPDAVILGKGMTGGLYPMAGCVYDPRLAERLERDPFVQQSTGGGAELGCVVTERVLDLVEQPGFLPRVQHLAARLAAGLAGLAARQPAVREVHQLGLYCSIGLADPALGPLLTRTCFERGLLVVFAGLAPRFVQLLPPLDLEARTLDRALVLLEEAVAEAVALASPPSLGRTSSSSPPPTAVLSRTARGRAVGLALHDPHCLARLGWTPGEPHAEVTPHTRLPGLLGDGQVVSLGHGPRAERVAIKPLPRFDSIARREEYGALIEAYVASLRASGLRVLDTWLWHEPHGLRAWVVQPAVPSAHLLPQRLDALSRGECRGLFRRLLRLTQAAQGRGLGVDAHLANWSLSEPHVLDPVLLDVTQPLLRDADGRLRLCYGDAGVPRVVERFLSTRMVEDLFTLESTIADVVGQPAAHARAAALRAGAVRGGRGRARAAAGRALAGAGHGQGAGAARGHLGPRSRAAVRGRRAMSTYRAGFAKGDLTCFERGTGMFGWCQPYNVALEVAVPLEVRAGVVEDAARRRFLLAVCDLGFISTALRREVERRCLARGLIDTPSALMLAATHTHSGPTGYAEHLLYALSAPGYFPLLVQALAERVVDALARAHDALEPARLRVGVEPVPLDEPVAFNRRIEALQPQSRGGAAAARARGRGGGPSHDRAVGRARPHRATAGPGVVAGAARHHPAR
jgi:putrescine aminotransferase